MVFKQKKEIFVLFFWGNKYVDKNPLKKIICYGFLKIFFVLSIENLYK